jgi:hypothetical protein
MESDKARALLGRLRETLARNIGVDTELSALGQVDACRRRAQGELIPLAHHMRGMILTLLSAHRSWRPLARRLGQLELVFGHYKPDYLERIAPQQLAAEVEQLGCGNRRVREQMEAIRPNLETMQRIEAEYGCMDQFVEHDTPGAVAQLLGKPGSRWKLKELGPALALEYLKLVGIRDATPGAHVRRICGPERLALLDGRETDEEAAGKMRLLAEAAGAHPVAFDNMLWLLGASEYGGICGAQPRCDVCELRRDCRSSRARALVQQSTRPVSLPR